MKKLIVFVLSLSLLVTTCLVTFSSDSLRGDMDGDGVVAANDLSALARLVGGIDTPEEADPDPVIIVPGILASELMLDGRLVWPVELGEGMDGMMQALTDLATLSVTDYPQLEPVCLCMADYTEGMNVGAQNNYGTLALALSEAVGPDNVYFFGYDWRLDNAVSADSLHDYIETVLTETGAGQVNLVAHSMGGLVIGGYLAKYKDEGKLGKVVTCGTPYLGSQDAVDILRDGSGLLEEYGDYAILEPMLAQIAATMPSIYELLPATGWEELSLDPASPEAADAVKKGYAFSQSVTGNLETVWSGVEHINVIGTFTDTPEGENTVNGDGTVTVRSATADGLFVTEATTFFTGHRDLVNEADPVAFIVAACE